MYLLREDEEVVVVVGGESRAKWIQRPTRSAKSGQVMQVEMGIGAD